VVSVHWWRICAGSANHSLRAAVVRVVVLLAVHLCVVAIDHVLAEHVVHSVVVVVVVTDERSIQVVHVVISLVDNWLVDEDVSVVVLQLLRASVLTVGELTNLRLQVVATRLLLAWNNSWWSSLIGAAATVWSISKRSSTAAST
jgi:hypothetical protein